jgi:hypothetical protein
MKWCKETFVVEYKMFDVGEKIKPTSNRCPLEEGVYTVVECHAPRFPGDDSVVFVEGRATGVSTEYLTNV